MPLQGRKPFVRMLPPTDLKPNEELFYCKITHEVFREYEQFFDRVILCNSLVWSCSVSGKFGLTFQEAIESEKNARLMLHKFPESLKKPLLYLSTLTMRGRMNDMCDDVYTFVRDRYFVGEDVEVTLNGIKKVSTVIKVISPDNKETKSPIKPDSKVVKRVKKVSADRIKYEVKEKELGKTAVVKSQCVSRAKGVYTKANNKLFLKNNTSYQDGVWKVTPEAFANNKIQNFEFDKVFSGPLPNYAASPTKKKLSILEKKKKLTPTPDSSVKKSNQSKLNFKKETEAEKARMLEIELQQRRSDLEERQKLKDKKKKQLEEERLKVKAQKEKEREVKKQEQQKMSDYLNNWKQPREDLECDDLKDLPKPSPVNCKFALSCFGDALLVCEFLMSFNSFLKVKDFFPHGFTFETMERVLLSDDIQGPFNDLIQLLMESLFEFQNIRMKPLLTVHPRVASSLKLPDDSSSEGGQFAKLAVRWAILHHGSLTSSIPLDSFSITEILRMHILSSGSLANSAIPQYNGTSEDPALEFKKNEAVLIEKLSTVSVFELGHEERMKIITLLISQVIISEPFSQHMEKTFIDSYKNLTLKSRKLRGQIIDIQKKILAKAKPEENGEANGADDGEANGADDGEANGADDGEANGADDDEDMPIDKIDETIEDVVEVPPVIEAEETSANEDPNLNVKEQFKLKLHDIKSQMAKLKMNYQGRLLGRDRAYRRFWLFRSLPGVFVEDDDANVGSCLLKETLQIPPNAATHCRMDGSVGSIKKFLQHLDENKNGSSDKENDILQDLAIIQNDFSIPLKARKLSDLNTRVDTKKSVMDNLSRESLGCAQCKEKTEASGATPWFCPHSKPSTVYGMCTASIDTCPVHNLNAPRTKWSFYHKRDDYEALLNSLNPRGFRERALRKTLLGAKYKILDTLAKCQPASFNVVSVPDYMEVRKSRRKPQPRKSPFAGMKPAVALEMTLRDMILEMEERIFAGALGSLKVPVRKTWREAVQRCYFSDEQESKNPTMDIDKLSAVVKELSSALLDISNGIESKYLSKPLVKASTSYFASWQASLSTSTSLSQVFVHLGSLERSVTWSRSVLEASCKRCRKKNDHESMLLCDECDSGYHLYCLKPALKEIPEGDWFCFQCQIAKKEDIPDKRPNYKESDSDASNMSDSSELVELGEEDEEEESDGGKQYIEVCETCKKPGTVICCDKCPKVYHLDCVGVRRIPRGEWVCPKCLKKDEFVKKIEKHSPTGTHGTRAHTTLENIKKDVKMAQRESQAKSQRDRGQKRKARAIDDDDDEDNDNDGDEDNDNDEYVELKKPPAKKAKLTRKSTEKENPFKKVYKDSAVNMTRRRSKSSGATDMLDYKTCLDLLVELMHHPSGWPFLVPVSKKDAPDYHQIIRRPMDFGTIRSNLNNMTYRTNTEFVRDVYLVLQNCELFNPRASVEYKAAQVLSKEVKRLLNDYALTHTFVLAPLL